MHDELHSLYGGLLKAVEKRRETTGSVNCIADRILDQNEKIGLTNHNVMLLAGVTLKGGSDTTASTLASFVQAMIAFPEVQKKAHTEIDTVIGENRIPVWSDHSSLPYVATLVKETMRWRPTAPLGVPHALSEGKFPNSNVDVVPPSNAIADEWVDGKLLPKGAVVFVNVWGLHHDEMKFSNSDVFDPDHYRGRTASPAEYANSADYENRDHYGFGRSRLSEHSALATDGIIKATAVVCALGSISLTETSGMPLPSCSGRLNLRR
jgi:cytochrome P450